MKIDKGMYTYTLISKDTETENISISMPSEDLVKFAVENNMELKPINLIIEKFVEKNKNKRKNNK